MKPYLIEPVVLPRDLRRIHEIGTQGFSRPWTEAMFVAALDPSQRTRGFIAREPPGAIVGYCIGQLIVDELHIHAIAVDPSHRQRGIGRQLLQWSLTDARQRGIHSVTLEVRESNLAARSLYDSMGFVLAATRPGYYTDPPEGALIYWRRDDQHDPSLSR